MVDKVITDNADFMAAWEKKKKQMSKFHKVSNALRCVFSGKK